MLRPQLLDEIVAHYRALLGDRLVGLALYGSQARGEAGADSDIDLFLLADSLPDNPFDRIAALPLPPLDITRDPPLSVRALRPDEWALDIAPLDLDIALDARVLYDRDGSLGRGLALIRRRIEEAGLVREADLTWKWKRWPTRRDWYVGWDGVRL